PTIWKDATAEGALIEAGVEHARAVIACTNSDLVNLEIVLDARKVRPKIRVIVRMHDQQLARKIRDGFNIQVAFSAAALATPTFAAAAIDRSVMGSFEVGERTYVLSEFGVPLESTLDGRTVAGVRDEYDVNTLAIRSLGETNWAPKHDTPIPADSVISVVGPFAEVARLKEECGISHDLWSRE
ncbi:MAG: NAD-binding protein, partial [Acidimicrobiia bacterium]